MCLPPGKGSSCLCRLSYCAAAAELVAAELLAAGVAVAKVYDEADAAPGGLTVPAAGAAAGRSVAAVVQGAPAIAAAHPPAGAAAPGALCAAALPQACCLAVSQSVATAGMPTLAVLQRLPAAGLAEQLLAVLPAWALAAAAAAAAQLAQQQRASALL